MMNCARVINPKPAGDSAYLAYEPRARNFHDDDELHVKREKWANRPCKTTDGDVTQESSRVTSRVRKGLWLREAMINCRDAVAQPVDASPARSPQAVHSKIAHLVAGKSLVEIGTRNGDGMMCFARVAASVSAIEFDKEYYRKLEARAKSHSITLDVQCQDYHHATLDADFITWWQQKPLTNRGALRTLKRNQCIGLVRESAEAILLFDHSWKNDVRDLERSKKLFAWTEVVPFDEQDECEALKLKTRESAESGFRCERASGAFTVARLPVSRIPLSIAGPCQLSKVYVATSSTARHLALLCLGSLWLLLLARKRRKRCVCCP